MAIAAPSTAFARSIRTSAEGSLASSRSSCGQDLPAVRGREARELVFGCELRHRDGTPGNSRSVSPKDRSKIRMRLSHPRRRASPDPSDFRAFELFEPPEPVGHACGYARHQNGVGGVGAGLSCAAEEILQNVVRVGFDRSLGESRALLRDENEPEYARNPDHISDPGQHHAAEA